MTYDLAPGFLVHIRHSPEVILNIPIKISVIEFADIFHLNILGLIHRQIATVLFHIMDRSNHKVIPIGGRKGVIILLNSQEDFDLVPVLFLQVANNRDIFLCSSLPKCVTAPPCKCCRS